MSKTDDARRTAREQSARMRAEQASREKRTRMTLWVAVVAAVALVAAGVTWAVVRDRQNTPTLEAVRTFDYSGGLHTNTPVTYAETPPVGGEHHAAWLNCGVYDEPVPSEHAVHSLEHGAVWVTYLPDLPEDQVATLRERIPSTYMILSPMPDLPAPVVASAWNHQLQLTGADDPRLASFISSYRESPNAPEPGALCTNGTDTDLVQR